MERGVGSIRRHVIFGGSGFTGIHLARALRQRGEQVLVVDANEAPDLVAIGATFAKTNVADTAAVSNLPLGPDDALYNLAARQYHLPVPRVGQDEHFAAVNVEGTRSILELMRRRECRRMMFFSTDMVYGLPQSLPVTIDHRRHPIGPYGRSKRLAEDLCIAARNEGMAITIFRPRLIVGPGRLGILTKLFRLIRAGLPVPLIGDGSNRYQMVSVFDCVSATLAALDHGFPNDQFNLGSDSPPTVRELLQRLIVEVRSRSFLVSTPGTLVKAVLSALERLGAPLMYAEQYRIADVNYLIDIGPTKRKLGWQPKYGDAEMIAAAYREFLSQK